MVGPQTEHGQWVRDVAVWKNGEASHLRSPPPKINSNQRTIFGAVATHTTPLHPSSHPPLPALFPRLSKL